MDAAAARKQSDFRAAANTPGGSSYTSRRPLPPPPAARSTRSTPHAPAPAGPSRAPPTAASLAAAAARADNALYMRDLPPLWQISDKPDALPPFAPITPNGVGRATTYPTRLRLGTTALMQPLPSAVAAAAAAFQPVYEPPPIAVTPTVLGKRNRSSVNYAEMEQQDDYVPDPLDEHASDGEFTADLSVGGGRSANRVRSLARRDERARATATPPPPSASIVSAAPTAMQMLQLQISGGKSYLGTAPPGNAIFGEPVRRTRTPWLSEEQLAERAKAPVVLVPIRIEFDTETHRIRDCFVWDASGAPSGTRAELTWTETAITPETFADNFCNDLGFPDRLANINGPFRTQIANAIRMQVDQRTSVAEIALTTEEQQALGHELDMRVILNVRSPLHRIR